MNGTQEQLNNLFVEWQRKQANEPLDSIERTAHLLSYKDKFAPDGVIGSENQWDNLPDGAPKVLYILPEPHWEDDKSYQKDYFWFQKAVYANGVDGDKSVKGGRILPKLAITQHFLETDSLEPLTRDYERLKNAVYMNLSKRGGGSSRNAKDKIRLKNYVEYYKDEIGREIKILNPNIIVCCGSGIKDLVQNLLADIDVSSMVIACWHPAAIEGYEKFFNKLKAAYEVQKQQPE